MEMEEKLYVITDINGNYYRIDRDDQLVMARNQLEAERMGFSEAVERVGNGRKAQFYSIIPYEENDSWISTKSSCMSRDLNEIDWVEYMNNFLQINTSVKAYEEELRQALSDVDMEICDILHCIELRQLTDSQSLDIMDQLRDCRESHWDYRGTCRLTKLFQVSGFLYSMLC